MTSHACTAFRPMRPRRRTVSVLTRLAILRERRALARLSDRALRDIGISRDAALREARRPFWDI
ncbi:DUF1127 domain-containing protein [Roseovarius sp. SCSIO 43702]|uniref:DUF1127 domain-containing protein n=1 Tax=Roseovarius sp. SCSIO 43702 TaxID=2823043 RepID=UPI001C73108A|nr:DUF1127 domain-containing protein [Roseovarius sp. SCSIO 43702]QYX56123.1 DUF1127 domain-containing protein [Roseovarius sp. SCSIO 43702]